MRPGTTSNRSYFSGVRTTVRTGLDEGSHGAGRTTLIGRASANLSAKLGRSPVAGSARATAKDATTKAKPKRTVRISTNILLIPFRKGQRGPSRMVQPTERLLLEGKPARAHQERTGQIAPSLHGRRMRSGRFSSKSALRPRSCRQDLFSTKSLMP